MIEKIRLGRISQIRYIYRANFHLNAYCGQVASSNGPIIRAIFLLKCPKCSQLLNLSTLKRLSYIFAVANLLTACTKYNCWYYELEDKGVLPIPSSMTITYQVQTMQFPGINCQLMNDTLTMSGSNDSNSFFLKLPVDTIQSTTYSFNSQTGAFYIYDYRNDVLAQASGGEIDLSVYITSDGTLAGNVSGNLFNSPYAPMGNGSILGNFSKVSVYVVPGSP